MKFKIPFTISNTEKLKKRVKFLSSKTRHRRKSGLQECIKGCDIELTRENYLAICFQSLIVNFIILFTVFSAILLLLSVKRFILFGLIGGAIFSFFVLFSQLNYPKIYIRKKQRNIEKNLLPALEDILVQLNSGIPLFNILTNISQSDYGELSFEFKKAVKRINSGEPDSNVLDDLGKNNPSIFFRRTLWQISNGIVAGSDMSIVIKDTVKALNEEQLIQIQDYGSKLNPLIVMYMLITVIIPTLSITFLTIISSMINIPKEMTPLLFITLAVFVILAQVMFLGLIKSKRPSLL